MSDEMSPRTRTAAAMALVAVGFAAIGVWTWDDRRAIAVGYLAVAFFAALGALSDWRRVRAERRTPRRGPGRPSDRLTR